LEILEAAYPVYFTQWALRPDSGGGGEHRGGCGAVYEIALLENEAEAFLFGDRGKFPPPGVAGGSPGSCNRFSYEQDDGFHSPELVSKIVGVKLKKDQRVRLETPGGGGFGMPGKRRQERQQEDLRLGYVTAGTGKGRQ